MHRLIVSALLIAAPATSAMDSAPPSVPTTNQEVLDAAERSATATRLRPRNYTKAFLEKHRDLTWETGLMAYCGNDDQLDALNATAVVVAIDAPHTDRALDAHFDTAHGVRVGLELAELSEARKAEICADAEQHVKRALLNDRVKPPR